jgi:aldehyde:ferredoxin oxidoreductase
VVFFSAGSGVETDPEALFEFVGRIRNMERAYEATLGINRAMDVLPKEFMDRPIQNGKFKGEVLESEKFEDMKNEYYVLRGWDVTTGIPSRETLEQQGLGDVAGDLARLGKLPSESPTGQAQETN